MINLSEYDRIVFDGHGTLYDHEYTPLSGAKEILAKYWSKSTLISNIGSCSSLTLKQRMLRNFSELPSTIITSMDLMLTELNFQKLTDVFHFGNNFASEELIKRGLTILNYDDNPTTAVFTSLPGEDWIQRSQQVLQLINEQKLKTIILANPDRLLPGPHIGITVGMMYDALLARWPTEIFGLEFKEYGKPYVSRLQLNISHDEKVLVVGDNIKTDGGLANYIKCDFALISSSFQADFRSDRRMWVLKSLEEMVG